MISVPTLKSNRTHIGLDIGSAGMRAVQLLNHKAGFVLERSVRCEFPSGNEKSPGENIIPQSLRSAFLAAGFSGRKVIAAADAGKTHFHALELPAATLQTQMEAGAELIKFEVGRLMSQPIDGLETRSWTLPTTPVLGPNVIGTAVQRSEIDSCINSCSQAGLTCLAVDSFATALPRFACAIRNPGDTIWGILDMGERDCRLIICVYQIPVLIRRVGPGGADWTRRIAQNLQLSVKAAEIHKRQHGLPPVHRVAATTEAKSELPGMILASLRKELTDLAGEIKRSYEYVLSCYPSRSLDDLIMVGAGSLMHNLAEYLSQALGIQAKRASSYLNTSSCSLLIRHEHREPLESLALAIGLVM